MTKLPKIGTRVRVQFGITVVEGEVIDAWDSGYGPQVTVSIVLEGGDDPITPTFRLGAVELAA